MRLRLAASVALRIASGTSRALPWPKPTRPFWSPTITSAAKPKRRPPFTTLATRLMCTSLSTNSLGSRWPPRSRPPPSRLGSRAIRIFSLFGQFARPHPLEIQAAFARGVGERLDAPVVAVAAAIEHDVLDALLDRALGDELADRLRRIDVGAGLQVAAHVLLKRRGRRNRCAPSVVDHLGVNVLARAMHGQPRAAGRCVLDGAAHGRVAPSGPCFDCGHPVLRYFFLPSLRKMYSPEYFTP